MEHHLEAGEGDGNRRNGYGKKTVLTGTGKIALAVVAGAAAESYLAAIPLKLIAGLGFIAIGLWTVFQHFHGG